MTTLAELVETITDTELRTIAHAVCTDPELDVLWLTIVGIGRRRGARILGIHEDTWRTRKANAVRKISAALRSEAA